MFLLFSDILTNKVANYNLIGIETHKNWIMQNILLKTTYH